MTDLLPDRPLPAPSRRAILGATWTAPVVVAASAAPTYAASVSATLSFDTFTSYGTVWSGDRPTRIETLVQVQHAYAADAPTLRQVTVSVVFPTNAATGDAADPVAGTGWVAGSVSGPRGGEWTYTFAWTGTLASGRSTPELRYVVARRPGAQKDTSLTAYASATQAPTVSRTTSAWV